MRQILFIILTILSLNLNAQISTFIPDTSVSSIILFDSASLIKMIPNLFDVTDYYGPGANIYLINKDESQIATLIFHSGSKADVVAEFNIDVFQEIPHEKSKSIKLSLDKFTTESNIQLNMTENKLIQIKGKDYTLEKDGDKEIIKYRITDSETSDFLIRHSCPAYYAEYLFIRGLLNHISFGFEIP